ncbi:MOSC domain-containing protein [Spongiibacter nanhainus]|uniref:MOSC domain-containing protein n=1 Tax=Spongiibacter nanhainus TaxID=2794344 RepID=A0A7T4R151_9GAMM|nr:MOSC domain-containing protein [Spongiibacter nanhainus]QQD18374.1 MOSC domain-containing protein [Spongiibacter nanhainus]
MEILSINTASAETMQVGGKSVTTGIFKRPRQGAVTVGDLGLEGDTIVHKNVHGGEDQAIYLYSAADYAWWSQQLGKDIPPGMFGENLTITDFHSGDLTVGDRLLINDQVLLEITAPRVPCVQFATKMGDSAFGKKFVAARRPGAYARVLVPGDVAVGDKLEWQPTNEDYATLNEIFVQWHNKAWSEDAARKALNSPISKIARRIIQERSGVSV